MGNWFQLAAKLVHTKRMIHIKRKYWYTLRYLQIVMQFEKNTFVFFEKNCFLWRKKHDLRKKHWKSVFFVFFYNKLCIKEKRKVVLLIWGPGDPVCPREVKITPPIPSCSPLCGSVCGNWPNWGLLCKLVAKTFFFLCLYDVCC